MDEELKLKLLGGIPQPVWDGIEAQIDALSGGDILLKYSRAYTVNLATGEVCVAPEPIDRGTK